MKECDNVPIFFQTFNEININCCSDHLEYMKLFENVMLVHGFVSKRMLVDLTEISNSCFPIISANYETCALVKQFSKLKNISENEMNNFSIKIFNHYFSIIKLCIGHMIQKFSRN